MNAKFSNFCYELPKCFLARESRMVSKFHITFKRNRYKGIGEKWHLIGFAFFKHIHWQSPPVCVCVCVCVMNFLYLPVDPFSRGLAVFLICKNSYYTKNFKFILRMFKVYMQYCKYIFHFVFLCVWGFLFCVCFLILGYLFTLNYEMLTCNHASCFMENDPGATPNPEWILCI